MLPASLFVTDDTSIQKILSDFKKVFTYNLKLILLFIINNLLNLNMLHHNSVTKLGQGVAYKSHYYILRNWLHEYFEKEKSNKSPLLPVVKVTDRLLKPYIV